MGACLSVSFIRHKVLCGAFTAKFEIGEEIGKGSFGFVFECTDRVTKDKYAVKRLDTPNEERKFDADKEAKICTRLENAHPNIVQYYGSFNERRWCYMVFELIKGDDLFTAIGKRTRYCERDAAYCMYQILDAVSYFHRKNIIHRDLKPTNVMICSCDNSIKVIDFGLGWIVDGSDLDWYGPFGNYMYIAPEILNELPYGKPADVWSCGALFYNLVSGIHPYTTRDPRTVYLSESDRHLTRAGLILCPEYEFSGITKDTIAVIISMLNFRQRCRLTAPEAMCKLRWLINRLDECGENLTGTIARLRDW